MTWLSWGAIKLLLGGWLKRLTAALGAALRWAGRNPWQAAVIALLCLSGTLWWHYSGKVEKLTTTIAQRDTTLKDMKAASAANLKAQLAQKARVEQHYKDIAHEADKEHAEQLADANDALARYIASHRVRPGEGGFNSSPASGGAEGGSAGLPENAAAETGLVAVSEASLHVCAADYVYAKAAYDWAAKLTEQPQP